MSRHDYFDDDVDILTLLAEWICNLYLYLISLHRHAPSSSSKQLYDNAKRPTRYVFTNHCPMRHVRYIKLASCIRYERIASRRLHLFLAIELGNQFYRTCSTYMFVLEIHMHIHNTYKHIVYLAPTTYCVFSTYDCACAKSRVY